MDVTLYYHSLKPYLFAIAYNMTGQVQEAEDIVQDAFEDMLKKETEEVRNTRSYFTRIVMNKAIDRLAHLKKQREQYPGLWLPEPYITQAEDHQDHDTISYAFLHLMEDLNPVERAVFILREAFDYSYEDVAELCALSPDNCRQVLHRAKLKIKQPMIGHPIANRMGESQHILQEFLNACLNNDAAKLSELLKKDVLLYSDGGGKVAAARKVLEGVSAVAKFLVGVIKKTFDKWSAADKILVNGQPALIIPDGNGIYMVLIPHFENDKVAGIHIMRNPDKIFLKNPVTNHGASRLRCEKQ
jgi:RNA polymerase sigma-70 factor, ECF subfamily